jgi:uncharacterized protein (TIGR01777 family)
VRVAVTGSTGLIGRNLVDSLQRDGHTVHRLVRDRAQATGGDVYWSVTAAHLDATALEGVDAVVHLAGQPFGRRWTEAEKARILDSRVKGTHLLAQGLASLDDPPAVLVSQSGANYYGHRGDDRLDEAEPPGSGFLADVCVQWEDAAEPARDAGIRVVHPRTGVVMAEEGPLIDKVEVPFKLGVGGRVGSGRQWVPWISLEDEVRAMRFVMDRDSLSGAVNFVAPEPVRNAELTKALGEVWHRPTLLPVPVFALRVLYGEMGVTLATESVRAIPAKLRDAGFEWRLPGLRQALQAALG